MQFGPVEPGKAMQIQKTVDTPGVFMYHCALGPSTDYHIKSGLAGAMIVYPRDRLLRRARELNIGYSRNGNDPRYRDRRRVGHA
jgi:FtsP/CotA-like multicopper oxidase with cupredoxin domain